MFFPSWVVFVSRMLSTRSCVFVKTGSLENFIHFRFISKVTAFQFGSWNTSCTHCLKLDVNNPWTNFLFETFQGFLVKNQTQKLSYFERNWIFKGPLFEKNPNVFSRYEIYEKRGIWLMSSFEEIWGPYKNLFIFVYNFKKMANFLFGSFYLSCFHSLKLEVNNILTKFLFELFLDFLVKSKILMCSHLKAVFPQFSSWLKNFIANLQKMYTNNWTHCKRFC